MFSEWTSGFYHIESQDTKWSSSDKARREAGFLILHLAPQRHKAPAGGSMTVHAEESLLRISSKLLNAQLVFVND